MPLVSLWRAVCVPILLFNSVVMGKLSVANENALEHVQRKFTKKLNFPGNLEYFERLKYAKLTSVQRQREKMFLFHLGNEIRNNKEEIFDKLEAINNIENSDKNKS